MIVFGVCFFGISVWIKVLRLSIGVKDVSCDMDKIVWKELEIIMVSMFVSYLFV